jgi:hypothetical protein
VVAAKPLSLSDAIFRLPRTHHPDARQFPADSAILIAKQRGDSMARSEEWTERHLTPRGWEVGSKKTDFSLKTREPPADRVLTVRYREFLSDRDGGGDKGTIEIWSGGNRSAIAKLKAQFGQPPEHL